MKITQQDVEHVARLARLSLTDAEKTRYAGQLESILGYIEKLNELDTSNVAPTSYGATVAARFREDQAEPRRLSTTDELLNNAPDREGPFFKVKKVIE